MWYFAYSQSQCKTNSALALLSGVGHTHAHTRNPQSSKSGQTGQPWRVPHKWAALKPFGIPMLFKYKVSLRCHFIFASRHCFTDCLPRLRGEGSYFGLAQRLQERHRTKIMYHKLALIRELWIHTTCIWYPEHDSLCQARLRHFPIKAVSHNI